MKKYGRVVAGCLVVGLLLVWCGFEGHCAGIRQSMIRLHVLANSDTAEDQALKLKVRDALTTAGADLLKNVDTREAAEQKIQKALPRLKQAAEQCIKENGSAYTVSADLTDDYFTTRTYESGTFPAGRYKTLCIKIGEGKGKNWWCVMYPPLCVASATDKTSLSDTFTKEQCGIIEEAPRYVVRLKVVEWVSAVIAFFDK
ncbi:MAG: stage II sporulation protein R [Clostridia bacterium]|nr:stage II sporulation protein R [Clostridia bacterium]